jgi:DNA-binding IclR family transcriptional regulator
MEFRVDGVIANDCAGGQSRLAGIEVALLILRLMERLREQTGDHTSALVLLAVIAITSEKLTRADLEPRLRSIEEAVSPERLTKCNVSSVASATGMNRETTRRYVIRLTSRGVLERARDGTIAFSPGYIQRHEVGQVLQFELEIISRSVGELLKMGALKLVHMT